MISLLPFILRPENMARYEGGRVLIGDRSKFPFEKVFHVCENLEEVALAIENMITQGSGPWMAAAHALLLAADEVEGKSADEVQQHLQRARARLVATRPTNTAMAQRLQKSVPVVETALKQRRPVKAALQNWIQDMVSRVYQDYAARARHGAQLINEGDGILTNCFAETGFILTLAMAAQQGKSFRVYVPETRPYLQGAHLTAPSIHELGIPVTLITDNMPAALMAQGKIHKYMTAADLITLDGHVVNKIGTYQNALASNHHHIPYYVFIWGLDPDKPDQNSIVVEERNPDAVKQCLGQLTTLPEIDAVYPAFDITPPDLVRGVVTTRGVLDPAELILHRNQSL